MGIAADVVESPGGRPRVQFVSDETEEGTDSVIDRDMEAKCFASYPVGPTATERKALSALNQLADACLKRQGRTAVKLNLDLSWDRSYAYGRDGAVSGAEDGLSDREAKALAAKKAEDAATAERKAASGGALDYAPAEIRDSAYDRAVATCVDSARREQLTGYVAEPALLFIDGPGAAGVPGFDLSRGQHRTHRRCHRPGPRPHRRRLGARRSQARTPAARAHRRRPADAGRPGRDAGARARRLATTRSAGWRRPSTTWPRTGPAWRSSAR